MFRNLVDFENLHKDPLKKCFLNVFYHSPTKTILLKYFQKKFPNFFNFYHTIHEKLPNFLTYYGNAPSEKTIEAEG